MSKLDYGINSMVLIGLSFGFCLFGKMILMVFDVIFWLSFCWVIWVEGEWILLCVGVLFVFLMFLVSLVDVLKEYVGVMCIMCGDILVEVCDDNFFWVLSFNLDIEVMVVIVVLCWFWIFFFVFLVFVFEVF